MEEEKDEMVVEKGKDEGDESIMGEDEGGAKEEQEEGGGGGGAGEGPTVEGAEKAPGAEGSATVTGGAGEDETGGGSLAGGAADEVASVPSPSSRAGGEGTMGVVTAAKATGAVTAMEGTAVAVAAGQEDGASDDDEGKGEEEPPQAASRLQRERSEDEGGDDSAGAAVGAGRVGTVNGEGGGAGGGGGAGTPESEKPRVDSAREEEGVSAVEDAESRGAGDQVRRSTFSFSVYFPPSDV